MERKSMLTVFLILLLAVMGFSQTTLTEAIDFSVTDLNGNTFHLFETLDSGNYVVLDFFFCSCGPCQINTPKVQYAFQYFGCNQSNVRFLSVDFGDTEAQCRNFEELYQDLPGQKFPSASGIEGGGTAVCLDYGIGAYPTVIIIAPDKSIVEQDIWPIADGSYLAGVIEGHGGIPSDCTYVGDTEISQNKHADFLSVYPNPVIDYCEIGFYLSKPDTYQFSLYNCVGVRVMNFKNSTYSKGNHVLSISMKSLPSGTYLFRSLSSNGRIDLTKIILVK